jgi:hypothetical protein
VFCALARRNQAGVHRGVIEVFFHDRFAFFDDAGDAIAVLAAYLFAEALKDLFQPFNLTLGLLEMALERLTQLGVGRRFRQLGQRLRQLLLGVVRVPQFVNECVMERACFSHVVSPCVIDVDGPTLHARRIRFAFEVPMLGDGRDENRDAGGIVAFHQEQARVHVT